MQEAGAGYFRSGLPFNRLGRGPRPLVVFQGLAFENRPLPRLMVSMYGFLGEDYTVYSVLRKPGLPQGCTLADMGDSYAAMIREEFGGPIDVIGMSTGGSIALHFAADHPELLRRLVIHSSAYRLSDSARALQMQVRDLALAGHWRAAYETLLGPAISLPHSMSIAHRPLVRLVSTLASLAPPADPSDLAVTIEAEDVFDFKHRLAEIRAPVLVAGGDCDPFYDVTLFRETAAGIPNARLILYLGMGHPVAGRQFSRDVLAFLRENTQRA